MDAIAEAIDLIENDNIDLIENDDSKKTYYSFPKRSDVKDFYKGKDFLMNILTFDIEEWFHILICSTKNEKQWNNYEYRLEANMDKIFSLLHKKPKCHIFCLGWVAKKFPHIIKK